MVRFIILTASVLAALTACAQRETYDLLSFIPPADWQRKEQAGSISFTRFNNDQTTFGVVAVYASRPATADIQKEFEADWNALVKSMKHVDVPAARESNKGTSGWDVVSARATINDPPHEVLLISFYGFGKSVSIYAAISDDSYAEALKNFIASIQLIQPSVQAQSPSVPGPAIKGAEVMAGMWRSACNDKTDITSITNAAGTGFSYMSITTGGLRTREVLFFEDGTVANYPGTGGFTDYQKQRRGDPNYWGTWHYENGAGTVKLDGISTPDSFTLKGGVMSYSGCQFVKLPWVEDLKLNGTYTWEADPAKYTANGMKAEPTLSFTADGRFSDRGAVYYLNHIELSYNSDYSDNKYGDGRYEIRRHTLSLYFDDGRAYHFTFMNFDGNKADPPSLSVGMKFMTRK